MISQCKHKGSYSKVDNSPKQKKTGSYWDIWICVALRNYFILFFPGFKNHKLYGVLCDHVIFFFVLFQGFKNHKLHDVLCDPGTADMTADVDFSFFRHLCLSTKASRWNWNISRKIMLLQVAWNFLLCNTNLWKQHLK